jgi:TonB-linked SusC/RagA family outer membrane protein
MKQILCNSMRHLVLLFVLSIPALVFAQDVSLSGKVSEANGESLVGVQVSVVGTGLNTYSDVEGNYRIKGRLNNGSYTLRFSYIGFGAMDKTFSVQNGFSGNIDVTLEEDGMKLDEVVVTGSTLTSTRRQLGNAMTVVSADKLEKSGSANALTSLQGKVMGAQITQNSGDPAGGISMRLRGVNSLRGNSDPLFIVDGVIISNSTTNVSQISVSAGETALGTNRMVDLNPNDIQDISIISGAAAAAQYGSRAANGVVLITTKRGQTGRPEITLSTGVNMNQLRKRLPINLFGRQYGDPTRFLHMINGALATDPGGVTVLGRRLPTEQVDVTRYDYQDDIFQNGFGTTNNLSFAAGTDKTKVFASLGYMENEGIVRNTNFRRYNLRLNIDQQLADWAKLSVGANYSNSFSKELPDGNVFFSPINAMTITGNAYDISARDANGNLPRVETGRVNPLSVIETFDITQAVNRGGGSLQLSLFPLKGLRLDLISGVDAISQLGKTYIPIYPYTVNPANYPNGYAGNATALSYLFNTDINLSYNRNLGESLTSTTTAGYNYQYGQSDYTIGTGENLSPAILTVNGAASTTIQTRYSLDQSWVSGYFLQQTFGFKNQLFVTLAGRIDGSSKFAPSQNNQFYPKVSASWVASDLPFWKNTFGKAWNGLKLRSSWGDAGGLTAIGSYDRFWQFSPVPFLGRNTILPGATFANPDVRPERTRELEMGGDLSFLGGRLNLNATYYTQKVTDLVVNRVLATSSGASRIVNNLGEMENKGIELMLNANVLRKKDFSIDLTGIYSRNRNKITKIVKSPTSNLPIPIQIATASGAPVFLIEGQPASVFFGTFWARDNNGNFIERINADGSRNGLLQTETGTSVPYTGQAIPEGSYEVGGTLYTPQRAANGQPSGGALRRVIGDPNPDFTASFGANLNWKRLSFGFLFDGVYGYDVFNADFRTRQGTGIGNIAEKELRGELPRGWIWSTYAVEEWRIDQGTFTKLRELSLSYNFGNVNRKVRDLSLTVVGRNLFSWDQYDGYDPETNAGGNSDLLRGVDFGNVPIPRTFQATLTAKF